MDYEEKALENVSILMVDDKAENLMALEGLLEAPGVSFVRALSGREALKKILEQDFALILLDVRMPIMDGFETARLIKQREKSRHIPIIFLTAVSKDDKFISEGYTVGAVDYMLKPFDPYILKSKVSVFVELYTKNLQLQSLNRELEKSRSALDEANEALRVMNETPAQKKEDDPTATGG
jgi:two-component system, cell cycle response regulator